MNSTCLLALTKTAKTLNASQIESCGGTRLDEGVSYVLGNTYWAVYQFIVFVVFLSVLVGRMVNTYQRIHRQSDIQWKFFR